MQDDPTSAPGDDSTQVIDESPPTSLPGFTLRDEVGRGGMGVVYRADDLALGREVAVKILQHRFGPNSSVAVRFLEEARITAQLQHPGVPAVYQVGSLADGRPFLAMKLIRGQTLDALLKAGEPLDVPAVFESIAQAVGYAHAHDVIHRDLKPANIMVGAFGEVQVMDWGLSKVLVSREPKASAANFDPEATTAPTAIRSLRDSAGSLTEAGSVLGTPAYMAPEQAGGELHKIDARSDVFGLGAILCAMLTGKPPFEGESADSVRLNAVRGRTENAFARLNQCPADPELIFLCKRCLSFDKSHRPSSGDEVAAAVASLRRAADGRAKTAEREKISAEVRRRSFQRAAIAVALVLLLGLLGTGVGLWQANSAKLAAQTAEQTADAKRKAAEEAEARETEQRKKAEAETALANEVKQFLQFDVLLLADPATQQRAGSGVRYDADVRLRDVVLRAADRIEGKFKDRPLVEAEIRNTLGFTLLGMGRPELAAKQFERVHEIRRRLLGPDRPETLQTMKGLANSYFVMGRHPDALKVRAEMSTLKKSTLGPDHPETLANMSDLASSYHALGRNAEALKLREETLALMKSKLGLKHTDTAAAMNNLANSYLALERFEEAARLHQEALALRKVLLGHDNPETLRSMNNVAISFDGLGRHDEALKLNEEALVLMRSRLGPTHPETLRSMHNLALSYEKLGRNADAVKLLTETVALRKTNLGFDHLSTLLSMHNLANNDMALGRHAEALKLHEETVAQWKIKLPPDHTFLLAGMRGVAECLLKLDRGAEALPIIDDCLKRAVGKQVDPELVPSVMYLRLQRFLKAGDPAGCRETADKWEKLDRKDAESLYQAACIRSVCATVQEKAGGADASRLANEDADRAVAWLAKAVAAGYKDVASVQKAKDLDALRNRPDFKSLLADLEKNAPPPKSAKK